MAGPKIEQVDQRTQIQSWMQRMARSRNHSSIGFFLMMPFAVATQAVKCPPAMEYTVWGVMLALGAWGVL